jgi:hypothetical protein
MKDRVIFDAEVSERKILLVPVHTIRHTPYNPPARTAEGAVLTKLVDTIKEHGLQYPLLITPERDLVDGNRRLTAAKQLGWKTVECIVTTRQADQLFRDMNTSAVPIRGKGWLYIGRTGGALPKREAAMYAELHGLIGNFGIDKLLASKLGLNILPLCKEICAQGTQHRLAEVIFACAERKLTNKLNTIRRSDKTREEKRAEMDALLFGGATA